MKRPRTTARRRVHRRRHAGHGIDPYTITSLLSQLPEFKTMQDLREGLRVFVGNDELWDHLENARTAEAARLEQLAKFNERLNDLIATPRRNRR